MNRPGPGLGDWRTGFETRVLAALSPEEGQEWRAAAAQAEAEGTYLWADPYHCAVGTKP